MIKWILYIPIEKRTNVSYPRSDDYKEGLGQTEESIYVKDSDE